MRVAGSWVGVAWILVLAGAAISVAEELSADEVRVRWQSRLQGQHFVAQVDMHMNLAGLEETRKLVVYRDDLDGKNERVMVRFEAPPDLKNVSLLYLENQGGPNDYFLYQPSARRVRRLPASIADDDLYGIDLEFLGFGVAQSEPTRMLSMQRTELDGVAVFRIEEEALQQNPRFDTRTTWVDAESFIPLMTEHYQKKRRVLRAKTLRIESVQGIATPLEMHFLQEVAGREVTLRLKAIDYERAIPEEYFSVLMLIKSR